VTPRRSSGSGRTGEGKKEAGPCGLLGFRAKGELGFGEREEG